MSSFSQLFYEFFANFCVKTNTIFFKIDQNGQNNEFEKKKSKKFPRNQKQNFREIEIYDLRLLGKFQPHSYVKSCDLFSPLEPASKNRRNP